jgi:hypothetical protein
MCRAYSTTGEKRNACRFLVGKSEEKRPLRRCRCVDKNKMDFGD